MRISFSKSMNLKTKLLAIGAVVGAPFAFAGPIFLYQQETIENISPYIHNDPGSAVGGTSILTFNIGVTDKIPAWEVGQFTGLFNPASVKQNKERAVSADWYGSTALQVSGNKFGAQLHTYSAPVTSGPQPQLKTINYQHSFSQDIKPWSSQYGSNPELCLGAKVTVPSSWTGDGSNNQVGVTYILADSRAPSSRIALNALIFDNQFYGDQTFVDAATGWAVGSTAFGGSRYITTSPYSASFTTQSFSDERWFGYCITKQNIINFYNDFTNNPSYTGFLPNLDFNYLRLDAVLGGAEISIRDTLDKNGHMAFTYSELTSYIND